MEKYILFADVVEYNLGEQIQGYGQDRLALQTIWTQRNDITFESNTPSIYGKITWILASFKLTAKAKCMEIGKKKAILTKTVKILQNYLESS